MVAHQQKSCVCVCLCKHSCIKHYIPLNWRISDTLPQTGMSSTSLLSEIHRTKRESPLHVRVVWFNFSTSWKGRGSSVGIATDYGLDGRGSAGFHSRRGLKIFLFATASRPALGPIQSPRRWVPVVKQPGREADHSPPSSAEVKKAWSYTSTPPSKSS
jgi:hypothetical protein